MRACRQSYRNAFQVSECCSATLDRMCFKQHECFLAKPSSYCKQYECFSAETSNHGCLSKLATKLTLRYLTKNVNFNFNKKCPPRDKQTKHGATPAPNRNGTAVCTAVSSPELHLFSSQNLHFRWQRKCKLYAGKACLFDKHSLPHGRPMALFVHPHTRARVRGPPHLIRSDARTLGGTIWSGWTV